MTTPDLVTVELLVSGIVHAPIEKAWDVVARFTNLQEWVLPNPDGSRVWSRLLPGGRQEYCIGCIRAINIGEACYLEELTALDNLSHLLRYQLISAEAATNPFPGSFFDAEYRLQMWPVSISNATFVEYEAKWKTEPESTEAMRAAIGGWLGSAIRGLDQYCSQQEAPRRNWGSGGIGRVVQASRPHLSTSMNRSGSGGSCELPPHFQPAYRL